MSKKKRKKKGFNNKFVFSIISLFDQYCHEKKKEEKIRRIMEIPIILLLVRRKNQQGKK